MPDDRFSPISDIRWAEASSELRVKADLP